MVALLINFELTELDILIANSTIESGKCGSEVSYQELVKYIKQGKKETIRKETLKRRRIYVANMSQAL